MPGYDCPQDAQRIAFSSRIRQRGQTASSAMVFSAGLLSPRGGVCREISASFELHRPAIS